MKSIKLPSYIINPKLTKPGTRMVPICYVCKKVALAAYIKNNNLIWWCDHGKCNKNKPEKELIKKFEVYYAN